METTRLAKQDEPIFAEKCIAKRYETSTLFVATNFVILSQFHCGSQIVCSPLRSDSHQNLKIIFFHIFSIFYFPENFFFTLSSHVS